jgi:PleD family two-component response regulator
MRERIGATYRAQRWSEDKQCHRRRPRHSHAGRAAVQSATGLGQRLRQVSARYRSTLRKTGHIRDMDNNSLTTIKSYCDLAAMKILLLQQQSEDPMTRILARAGHEVLELSYDERPLRFLAVFRPDVIVIAGEDADRVCRAMRAAIIDTAIVVVVPGEQVDDRVSALDAGADDCVVTPFHAAELRARLWAAYRRQNPTNTAVLGHTARVTIPNPQAADAMALAKWTT